MMRTDEISDAEVDRVYVEATERLNAHAEHLLLGPDAGCGKCLFCHSCGVRLAAFEVVGLLSTSGVLPQGRYRQYQGPPVLIPY